MDKLLESMEKKLLPVAEKLNGQRHLMALRDGFTAIMPLMIIGAFAVMINSVFLDFSEGSLIGSFLQNPIDPANYPGFVTYIKGVMDFVSYGSLSILGVIAAGTISYSLTKIKGYEGLEAAIISISCYFITFSYASTETGNYVGQSLFGSANLITAILIAMIVGEFYTWCLKKGFRIKMPEGVPPAVERSFSALIPAALSLLTIAIVQNLVVTGIIPIPGLGEGQASLSLFVQNIIGVPLKIVGGGYAGMLVYAFFAPLLFFFGIHGPNTLAFLDQGIFSPAAILNADLISQGIISFNGILQPDVVAGMSATQSPSMYTKTVLDSFVMIGGSGATLGLVIAILIASKQEMDRKMAKYAFTPALFNINEPLIFGLPIVFNPILFIPFVIIQPILFTLATFAMIFHVIPTYSIPIPWTSPVGVGAFLGFGGSISAFLFAFVCLAISTLVYYPFVKVMNRANKKQSESK